MFKKIILIATLTTTCSTMAFAEGNAYLGGSIAATPSNGLVKIFGGYGKRLELNNNLYLGGEVNADIPLDHSNDKYGIGASILPGYFITQNTMIFGRAGLEAYHHNYYKREELFPQIGFGVQTKLTQHWDARIEYISSHDKQVGLGLVYKFD